MATAVTAVVAVVAVPLAADAMAAGVTAFFADTAAAALIALMLMQWPEWQHMECFSTQNDLAYLLSMLNINEIVFRAQCYKTFYVRNLRIFVIS